MFLIIQKEEIYNFNFIGRIKRKGNIAIISSLKEQRYVLIEVYCRLYEIKALLFTFLLCF